jgi:NADH dehydrogenase/NADH:ubiquinone oxidoreductase subunit G
MIQIRIDGRMYAAKPEETILEVARRNSIRIPALCYHEGVEPWGGCRLCLVEITKESWNGWKKIVTSCLYPVEENLIVSTSSPEVLELRAMVFELLMARCPESVVIRDLAAEYGVESTSLAVREGGDNCILCGLCTRICEKFGSAAISTVNRGINKEIRPPFEDPPVDCVGCLSCAMNCPTNAIAYEENEHGRIIWDREFELVACPVCGVKHITKAHLDFLAERKKLDPEEIAICDSCRRKSTAETFVHPFERRS